MKQVPKKPIDDGEMERGHITTCCECGCRGVFCDTSAGEVVGSDGRPVSYDTDDMEVLLVGRADGTDVDGVYCDDCA